MKEYRFELYPNHTLHIFLFHEVHNAPDLINYLASKKQPEFSFINANLIVDEFQLQVAACKALEYFSKGKLITKTIQSEFVFSLAASNNIKQSLGQFGSNKDTERIIIGIFNATEQDLQAIPALVKGREVDISVLPQKCDDTLIKKIYKITPLELQSSTLSNAVVHRIATRAYF